MVYLIRVSCQKRSYILQVERDPNPSRYVITRRRKKNGYEKKLEAKGYKL